MKKLVARISAGLVVCLIIIACHHTSQSSPTKVVKQVRPVVPTRTNDITAINPKAYSSAYQEFLQRASQGDAVAQFNLGRMYADGRGVEANDAQAFHWFQKAARQGLPDAQISLGLAYLFAKGTTQNKGRACKLFKQAMYSSDIQGKNFYQHYCE